MFEYDRGHLILWFRVPFDRSTWRNLALSGLPVGAMAVGYFSRRSHRLAWDLAFPAFWAVLALIQTFRRTVRFYQNGVFLPASEDRKTKARFLHWRQVERYHFDGALLDIEGTTNTLKGGPTAGATFKVPAEYQAQVMSLLAQNVH